MFDLDLHLRLLKGEELSGKSLMIRNNNRIFLRPGFVARRIKRFTSKVSTSCLLFAFFPDGFRLLAIGIARVVAFPPQAQKG